MNILIIKLGALGDFVLQLGYVFALHEKYPDAKFTFMTTKPFIPFIRCIPFISNIIIDDRPRYNLASWWKTCKKEIADKKWDLVFDIQASNRTKKKYFPIIRFLTPYDMHWGYLNKGGFSFFNIKKKHRFTWGKCTKTHIAFKPFPVDLSFCKGKKEYFDLLPQKPYILLIPGCSAAHPYKRWPAKKYLDIALRAEKMGIPSVVLGTKDEELEITTICSNSHAINFQNKASLLDIPELAQRACLVIGNDTGPVHLSCFSKTPVIVLFCEKTKNSAHNLPNIKNIIVPNLTDLSSDHVWGTIKDIL